MSSRRSPLVSRAFSLVEMLTVLAILAIVVAIIIPAMNMARRAAKNTDTLNTLSNLSKAIETYKTDKSRYPGYFNPRDMGSTANRTTYGFDTMSNIMLDLIGGVAPPNAAVGGSIIEVGPNDTALVPKLKVDLTAFGGTSQDKNGAIVRGYFTPSPKNMIAQSLPNQRFGGNQNNLLPSVVDSFGSPILAWAQDETPSGGVFAEVDVTSAAPNGAKFYWAQNSAFLDSSVSSLGKLAQTQNWTNGGSLIASNSPSPATNLPKTLSSLLGHPSSPDDGFPGPNFRPAAARGPIVLHAAGADGVFVGRNDRGGKGQFLQYTPNVDSFNGPLFDDQIMAAGH